MGHTQAGTYRKPLGRMLAVLAAAILLAYPLDWAVWEVRSALGHGMGTVTVSAATAATLKGDHFEVYSPTVAPVACSRSLLPQAGSGACWWLRRHEEQITQY